MQARDYQAAGKQEINTAWKSGVQNILYVLPCGGGKTFVFSDLLKDHVGASCAIAHRQELVSQMSLALARDGVRHKIIGPKNVIKMCVNLHMAELDKNFYDPNARCAVAGIDTLIRRGDSLRHWLPTVTKWVMDEAHHLLKSNKWGKGVAMFPNAVGLGVTATPTRTDGKGLGRHADGVFDKMIVGPSMRELINMGYLTDYRIFAPPSDLDLSGVDISKITGDYNDKKLKAAVRNSHIVGDVVSHYLRIANGKLGITFATDIETATDIANKFNTNGVPAAVVSSKTSDKERIISLRKFRDRELLQLVNVDIFGEGFDVPVMEVCSMARPTKSFGLYTQQFGRPCRTSPGKTHAIIIDHVHNIDTTMGGHGLPDAPRIWTLDARERRSSGPSDVIPTTSCLNPNCLSLYERTHSSCPYCGFKPEPADRSKPEYVDGDLCELDQDTLARMRGEIEHIARPVTDVGQEMINKYAPRVAVHTAMKRHEKLQLTHEALKVSIEWWGAYQRQRGVSDSESYRRFYFKFGVDVLTAQVLPIKEATVLANQINNHLGSMGNA